MVEVPQKKITVVQKVVPTRNVILILKDAVTGRVERIVEAQNIVTNEGAKFYAKRGALETPTFTFNAGKIALASSFKATEAVTRTLNNLTFGGGTSGIRNFDSGYPKTNDNDADNTGAGIRVLTYRRTYTTAEANFTIKALAICRNGATTNPGAASSLRVIANYLTLATSEFVTKTSSQTLKVFVNHSFAGV